MSSLDVWAVGFAEGVSVIFLRTPAGLYAVELNSGQANKVGECSIEKVMPYTRASALEHGAVCWPLMKPHARLSVAVRRRDQVASRRWICLLYPPRKTLKMSSGGWVSSAAGCVG